jgi:hypothetical protein
MSSSRRTSTPAALPKQRRGTEIIHSLYHADQSTFAVAKLTQFPKPESGRAGAGGEGDTARVRRSSTPGGAGGGGGGHGVGGENEDDDDVTVIDSVYLPSDDSDADGDSELWAPDGRVRPEFRGSLSFPEFLEDEELAHVCTGIDVGTAVHEVSFLVHAPIRAVGAGADGRAGAGGRSGSNKKTGQPAATADGDGPVFVTKKFGFHLHASLCVERQGTRSSPRRRSSLAAGAAPRDANNNNDDDDDEEERQHAEKFPLSSPRTTQRGKLVRLDSVFSVDFEDQRSSSSSSSSNTNAAAAGSGAAARTPADLCMLPFNKRAVMESARTEFPEDDPVRLWMATYTHHEPRDAFLRAMQELGRVARDYLVRYAPATLDAAGAPAWAKALQNGFTSDAVCYTLPLAFARELRDARELLRDVDAVFAERAESQHALLVVTSLFDLCVARVSILLQFVDSLQSCSSS